MDTVLTSGEMEAPVKLYEHPLVSKSKAISTVGVLFNIVLIDFTIKCTLGNPKLICGKLSFAFILFERFFNKLNLSVLKGKRFFGYFFMFMNRLMKIGGML